MRWRRLGISLAVALLLHAAIAGILVLAWRQFVPPGPTEPVIVELAPPAAQPRAEPAEPTFATTAAGAGRAVPTEHADIEHPFAQLPARADAAAAGSEATFAARAHEPAPAENANAKPATREGGARPTPSAQGSGAEGPGVQAGGAPIDTRIAPPFHPPGKKPPRTLARNANQLPAPRRLSALTGNIVINAIGARVEDRVRAANARAAASGEAARNAVGNATASNPGSGAARDAEGVVVNAIGMAIHVRAAVPPAAAGIGASTGGQKPSAAAGLNGGAVNGTGLGSVATRAATIGGAARSLPGALNGTDFRSRHP